MLAVIVIIHILVALGLISVVLLQAGKGQSIGAAFGGAGSSQTLFGSRGPATFLSRVTTVMAALFMLTSLGLAYFSSGGQDRSSIIQHAPPESERAPAPMQQTPALPETGAPETPATEGSVAPPPSDAESTPAPMQPAPTQPVTPAPQEPQ